MTKERVFAELNGVLRANAPSTMGARLSRACLVTELTRAAACHGRDMMFRGEGVPSCLEAELGEELRRILTEHFRRFYAPDAAKLFAMFQEYKRLLSEVKSMFQCLEVHATYRHGTCCSGKQSTKIQPIFVQALREADKNPLEVSIGNALSSVASRDRKKASPKERSLCSELREFFHVVCTDPKAFEKSVVEPYLEAMKRDWTEFASKAAATNTKRYVLAVSTHVEEERLRVVDVLGETSAARAAEILQQTLCWGQRDAILGDAEVGVGQALSHNTPDAGRFPFHKLYLLLGTEPQALMKMCTGLEEACCVALSAASDVSVATLVRVHEFYVSILKETALLPGHSLLFHNAIRTGFLSFQLTSRSSLSLTEVLAAEFDAVTRGKAAIAGDAKVWVASCSFLFTLVPMEEFTLHYRKHLAQRLLRGTFSADLEKAIAKEIGIASGSANEKKLRCMIDDVKNQPRVLNSTVWPATAGLDFKGMIVPDELMSSFNAACGTYVHRNTSNQVAWDLSLTTAEVLLWQGVAGKEVTVMGSIPQLVALILFIKAPTSAFAMPDLQVASGLPAKTLEAVLQSLVSPGFVLSTGDAYVFNTAYEAARRKVALPFIRAKQD